MTDECCGCALVLIYENGMLVRALAHAHDGGEPYMGPVLRRGILYARTHYDSGDIARVLLSEPEMRELPDEGNLVAEAVSTGARHVYYVKCRTDAAAGRKRYSALALHLGCGKSVSERDVPSDARRISQGLRELVRP